MRNSRLEEKKEIKGRKDKLNKKTFFFNFRINKQMLLYVGEWYNN